MTACSLQSASLGEPLAGTAPTARAWIVIEHPGPWGRDALAASDLPEPVRTHLAGAKPLGITVLLARHSDRLARSAGEGINVWVARTAAGGARLRHAILDDVDTLARWDLDALAHGELPAMGAALTEPLLLVCTHSKRDQCCAVHGRARASAIQSSDIPGARTRVWECSHIGGHRFAPVTLSLPTGTVHARLTLDEGVDLLERADQSRVLPGLMRGRSCFPAPLQTADIAVRLEEDIDGADDLDVLVVHDDRAMPVELGWAVPMGVVELEVRHRDGRSWRVDVRHVALGADRPESCGADPLPMHAWEAADLRPAAAWC